MKKPHITPTRRYSPWPGAMSFWIKMPNGLTYHLSVDSWQKLARYIEIWMHDHSYPAGIDFG